MSTTAVVTPYDPEAEKMRNGLAVREEKAVAKLREDMRKKRLQCVKLPVGQASKVDLSVGSLTINTGSMDLIKRAAETIGYTAKALDQGKVALAHPDGSVINISKTKTGKVTLSGSKQDLTPAKAIVREYTAMQIYNHLQSRGMTVQAKRTQFGEITLEARVKNQQTVVSTDVRRDGVAVIDVSGVKGKGCQDIITGITRAIDGSQIDTSRKNEFFLATEEESRINV
jgi:hypothetical protein